MGWRIVRQPNGYFARFSETVDDFTDMGMGLDEALHTCQFEYGLGKEEAIVKVRSAIDAGQQRFEEAMGIIERVHGKEAAQERRDACDPYEQEVK